MLRAIELPGRHATEPRADEDRSACCFRLLQARKADVGEFKAQHSTSVWYSRVRGGNTAQARPHINRAELKFHEIHALVQYRKPSTSLHLCDAPGGFLYAAVQTFGCQWRASSLVGGAGVPCFHKLVRTLPNGRLVQAPSGGDVRLPEVRAFICRQCDEPVDLITADGAFDNEHDHANEELNSLPLFESQIRVALAVQAKDGTFILKIFDGCLLRTHELIALLRLCYQCVAIVKPVSSRSVNSERYVVCTQFVGVPTGIDCETLQVPLRDDWRQHIADVLCDFADAQCQAIKLVLEPSEA